MSFRNIEGAITVAVLDWAAAEGLTMYTPNMGAGETPPEGIYGRLEIEGAGVFAGDFAGKKRTHIGTAGIVLSAPHNTSTGQINQLADSLNAAFPVNRKVTQGDTSVDFTAPVEKSNSTPAGDRFMVTLFLTYRSAYYE